VAAERGYVRDLFYHRTALFATTFCATGPRGISLSHKCRLNSASLRFSILPNRRSMKESFLIFDDICY
jgi:hypothetical protein